MAITAVLVFAGHNRLRYLITSTAGNESVSIESDGGPTPDLLTDSLAGPLKQILRVKTQGYGKIPTGALNQAQARALLQSDNNAALVGPNKPTAMCQLTQITGTPNSFTVDAVIGPTDPLSPGLTITNVMTAAASAYLDVGVPGTIGA